MPTWGVNLGPQYGVGERVEDVPEVGLSRRVRSVDKAEFDTHRPIKYGGCA